MNHSTKITTALTTIKERAEKATAGPTVEELVSKLKSLRLDYDAVGIVRDRTPGKWPFASEAEVKLRRDANRISSEIMSVERQIIEGLMTLEQPAFIAASRSDIERLVRALEFALSKLEIATLGCSRTWKQEYEAKLTQILTSDTP